MTRRLHISATPAMSIGDRMSLRDPLTIEGVTLAGDNAEELASAPVHVPYNCDRVPAALRIAGKVEVDAESRDGGWSIIKVYLDDDLRDMCDALASIDLSLRQSTEGRRDGDEAAALQALTIRAARDVAGQVVNEADAAYAGIYRSMMKRTRESTYDVDAKLALGLADAIRDVARHYETASVRAAEVEQYATGTMWYGRRSDLSVIAGTRLAPFVKTFSDRLTTSGVSGMQRVDAINAMLGSLIDATAKVRHRRSLINEIILGFATEQAAREPRGMGTLVEMLEPEIALGVKAVAQEFARDAFTG